MIRQAQAQDVEAVWMLAKNFATSFAVDETAFRATFARMLCDSSTRLVVAEVENVVVGYVLAFSHDTFYANGRVTWIEEIAVDVEYRRQGIGKSLIKNIEDWAARHDCKLIALATRRAANFYEAIGYEASATYFRKVI